MKRMDFCSGWTYRIWGRPGSTPVTLPHDYSQFLPRTPESFSGSAGGWFQGADIIYDRELHVTEDMLSRQVMLEFEGVFPGAEVYLDDTLIVRQPYGCLSFLADLTPHLRAGVQKIRVNVHGNALPNARWYMGTGICRPVYLLQGPRAHIEPRGLHADTVQAGDDWHLSAQIRVSSESVHKDHTLLVTLKDPEGLAMFQSRLPITEPALCLEKVLTSIRAWTPETPVLYTLTADLYADDVLLDTASIPVGFREVRLDREQGLLLNGGPIKLRGGCVHQDNGLLGAVSLPGAEYRKALLLKEFGFNAVRCAHNPPAPAFLDACDELGLLVVDEFTDMWNIGKNPYDYHLFFQDRWKQDLESMILRDRHHPSVIMWSIGNEIPERDGSGDGYVLCRAMCGLVRDLDRTRPVTAALNNIGKRRLDMLAANVQKEDPDSIDYFGALSEDFLAPLDVAGYNYLARRYEHDLTAWPERFLCGMESVAGEALECWQKTLRHPRVIGDFAWAAMDYLGEAGIGHVWHHPEDGEGFFETWPWRQANCGDMDLCGRMNPAGNYRRAVWGTLEKPCIAVQHPAHFHEDGDVSYWAWPERETAWDYPDWEGHPIQVDVYSPGRSVTLSLNGRTIGTTNCRDCIASFDLTYEPGLLEAVDDAGNRSSIRTPGKPARLSLSARRFGNLAWVEACITDDAGIPCAFDHRTISFDCAGGDILACGSADPASEEGFQSGKARAWRASVCAIVRIREGNTVVSARADGLPQAGSISFL